MRGVALIIGLFLVLTPLFGQDYWVFAGAGWNRAETPEGSGFLNFGANLGSGNFALTTVEMTSRTSSIRAGYARLLKFKDRFGLLALGDAGVISGEGSVGGAFSGGGILTYDISKWTRVAGTHAVFVVRVNKSSMNDVQPTFGFGVGKVF